MWLMIGLADFLTLEYDDGWYTNLCDNVSMHMV